MAHKLNFSDYSDSMQTFFKDVNDIKTFAKIGIDTYKGTLKKYSKDEANAVIRAKILEIANLPENPDERQIRRAFRKTSVKEAVFEIIEEVLDDVLVTGWGSDPFFRRFVDFKTGVLGQKNSYYIKNTCVLHISKIANGHHNLERQRLTGGTTRTISTAKYGAKVYMEMSRFLQGVEDWNELIDAIALAFTNYINTMIHTAVMTASQSLPVQSKWNVQGEATPANKSKLKKLISDVQIATGSKAVIMGTAVALGELVNFGEVAWASEEAKSDIYKMGRVGTFEGTTVIEIPQAFALNDVNTYLEDDNKLLIMPENIDKFIKFFYEGAEEIREVSESGDNGDDTKEYEFCSIFGLEVITNSRFGLYTISA